MGIIITGCIDVVEWGGGLTLADAGHEECNISLDIGRECWHLGYKLGVGCD